MVTEFQNLLEGELEASKSFKPNKADWLEGKWSGLEIASGDDRRGTTAVEIETLKKVGAALTTVPDGFNIHKTLTRNVRSEEHTSELQSLMRISYAVFCLKKKKYK